MEELFDRLFTRCKPNGGHVVEITLKDEKGQKVRKDERGESAGECGRRRKKAKK